MSLAQAVVQSVRLLLPALLPSWRFFAGVGPSPRIEYRLNQGPWQEFRPRPEIVTPRTMLKRLFWNPQWNEQLFLVTLAERLVADGAQHSVEEIFARLGRWLQPRHQAQNLQFRLVFLTREEEHIERTLAYLSPIRELRS